MKGDTFQDRLRCAAAKKGWTRSVQFEKGVGFGRSLGNRYWNWRTEVDNIPAVVLLKIADALDVRPAWLLTGDGSAERQKTVRSAEEWQLVVRYRQMKDDEKLLIRNLINRLGSEGHL